MFLVLFSLDKRFLESIEVEVESDTSLFGELGKKSLNEVLLGEFAQINLLLCRLSPHLDRLGNNLRHRDRSGNLELGVEELLLRRLLNGHGFGDLRLDKLIAEVRLGGSLNNNRLFNNSRSLVL